jgi:hypothetical protein
MGGLGDGEMTKLWKGNEPLNAPPSLAIGHSASAEGADCKTLALTEAEPMVRDPEPQGNPAECLKSHLFVCDRSLSFFLPPFF